MKKSVVLLAAVAGSVAAHAANPAGAEPTHVTVTPETLAQTPVSELLYSNFLELGYGYQVEAMMTEMLFNRSFETYTPYNSSSWYWFGLFKDARAASRDRCRSIRGRSSCGNAVAAFRACDIGQSRSAVRRS